MTDLKPVENLGRSAYIAILVLVLLGLFGGSLILAHSGFETLPKTRGVQSVFVPLPEAYLLVAVMYGQSLIGIVALLRAQKISKTGIELAVVGFVVVACLLVSVLL